jgi:MFS family permease
VLVILLTGELGVIYFGGGMIGAGAGLFFATNWALGTDLAPPSRAAEFLGVSNLAGAGAGAIGAYIGGPIADSFASSQLELGYSVLLAIFGALFVSSALVLPLIHQPKSETTP